MRISIIIPTYNRKDLLRRCLSMATNQGYLDYEVIVVDDGSTDKTGKMVQQEFPEVQYIRQEINRGPAAARNRGIEAATGEIVAFTDDDCIPPHDWLVRLAKGFREYPSSAAVGGIQEASEDMMHTHLIARYERFVTRQIYRLGEKPIIGAPAPGGTNNIAVWRHVLLTIGGFDESFPVAAGEDADLLRRIAERGYTTVTLPVRVIHMQPYTWPAFLHQQVRRGIGAAHFHRKWGSLPTLGQDLLRLFAGPLVWIQDTVRYRRPLMTAIHTIATTCQTWGRLRGRFTCGSRGSKTR